MTDAANIKDTPGADVSQRTDRLRAGLRRRYAREGRFKLYGLLAIGLAVGFLLLLLGRIFEQGHTAFYAHSVTVPVYMDPARIDRAYPQGSPRNSIPACSPGATRPSRKSPACSAPWSVQP